jgi:hypothetical protein
VTASGLFSKTRIPMGAKPLNINKLAYKPAFLAMQAYMLKD